MSTGQIVKVKIPNYLKDYFILRFGKEPIKATKETKLFIIIAPYLAKVPVVWRPPEPSDDSLLLELPYSRHIRVETYCHIDPCSYTRIKTSLYHLFCADFIRYVNLRIMNQNYEIHDAINEFMDTYLNWDKANFDTLKKIYDRYRYPEFCYPGSKKINEQASFK